MLKEISRALRRRDTTLSLRGSRIGDAGAAALGAALRAAPTIRFSSLDLARNNLTAAGVASLVPALRRPWAGGLRLLRVGENRDLGDAGVAALSEALSGVSTLEWLNVDSTGCGDDGLAALAAALPTLPRLRTLNASFSRAGARGWVALADALPSLPAFERLNANNSPALGYEGAAALEAAVVQCPRLQNLYAQGCGLDEAAAASLRVAALMVPTSAARPHRLKILV